MAVSSLYDLCIGDLQKEKIGEEESEKENSISNFEQINREIDNIYGNPSRHLFHLLRLRCRAEAKQKDYHSVGLSLLQSQSISFRLQALIQYNKRLRKLEVKRKLENATKSFEDPEEALDKIQREILVFRPHDEERREILNGIKSLPKDWRVVQISVDPNFRESLRFKSTPNDKAFEKANFGLIIVAIDCGSDEPDSITVHTVNPIENSENITILAECQDIVSNHHQIFRAELKETRLGYELLKEKVDDRMKSLLNTIENKWLGFSKVFFFGQPRDESRVLAIKKQEKLLSAKYFSTDENFGCSGRKKLLQRLLDLSSHLTESQVERGLARCFEGSTQQNKFSEFTADFYKCVKESPAVSLRHPTILILDKEVQGLPWEGIKCFQDPGCPQPFSRVPSFPFLLMLHANQRANRASEAVRKERIFYVLNPDKNLAKTQERLEPQFQRLSLGQGVVGEQPSLQQMTSVLSEWDAYMYCGHGSNLKNVPGYEIEKLHVHAVPLLFGCNSGKMVRLGRQLDPLGTVSYYLIATAPRLLGFLWSITDRDVDIWTIKFLEHWIGKGPGSHETDFLQAVANLRNSFDWVINSTATVVYGLPDLKDNIQ